jgi:tetratricopeptide (TPR) repeat protein
MLIVLDYALDAGQVRLDLLPEAEARHLLERRLGSERIAGEPRAVAEIVERCAGLPLALAVVAARAATYPDFRLGEIATELRSGLGSFASGDGATDLWTVFSSSYRALEPPEQRLFRLLALHPGPSVTAEAAAALVDAPVPATRRHLAELTRTHLLTEHRPGRYTTHDLLRAYAEQADPAENTDDARRRMLAHYRDSARAAAVLIDPHRSPVGPDTHPAPVDGITDAEQAMEWFAAERPVLLAVIAAAERAGLPEDVYDLAQLFAVFLQRRGHYRDLADTQHAALRAARRIGGPDTQARSHRGIATAYFRLCHYDESERHLQHALDLSRENGDARGTAYTHLAFSTLFQEQGGRDEPALGHARHALDLFQENGDATGQARSLNIIGWLHTRLGDRDAAIAACEQALARLEELGDRHGQGMTWDSLGYAYHESGDLDRAITCYRRAVDILADAGDRYIGAESLDRLGDCHAAQGDLGAALDAWRSAVTVLDDLGHPSADAVRQKLRRSRP